MPGVVTLLAIRAGLRDAREGRPPFLWALLFRPPERARLVRSAVHDVGRVLVVALVVDTAYQLVFLRAFHPLQALVVAALCALLPYVAVRGPVAVRETDQLSGRFASVPELESMLAEGANFETWSSLLVPHLSQLVQETAASPSR